MYTIAHGTTDVGKKRRQNEDRLLIDADLGLFIVADGMGGHAAGEVAATIAVEVAARFVREHANMLDDVSSGDEDPAVMATLGEQALLAASNEVHERATSGEGSPGMGCTMTLLLVADGKAALAHVGDTRCYLWRQGETHQLTNDHTLAADLSRAGALEPENVETHMYAHVLSRVIGSQEAMTVETLMLDITAGDRFLLCSDGLTTYTRPTDWFDDRLGEADVKGLTKSLIAFANAAGGSDNITALVVGIEADEDEIDEAPEIAAAIQGKLDALGSVFLFRDLSMARLSRVLDVCTFRDLDADELVIAQDDDIDGLYVVVDGQLSLDRDGEALFELTVGDHVGAAALARPRPARASLWTREPTQLLVLDSEGFRQLVQLHPWLGIDLLERLSGRLVAELDDAFETITSGGPLGSGRDRLGIL